MKRFFLISCLCLVQWSLCAQEQEAKQLLLNVEKLAQFKKILYDMYKYYQILNRGYNTIKNIASGNFKLHKAFLDGLLQVSPAVRQYHKVAAIIEYERRIVLDAGRMRRYFQGDDQFSSSELLYLSKVYSNLVHQSSRQIEELWLVVTAGKLRMSDDERLQAIDRIYESVQDQYHFLKEFGNKSLQLSYQRRTEQADVQLSRRLQGF